MAGDVHQIKVGSETNIQDNTLVHVAKTNVSGNVEPTIIGDRVTIGIIAHLSFTYAWFTLTVLMFFVFLFMQSNSLKCNLRSPNLLFSSVIDSVNMHSLWVGVVQDTIRCFMRAL